MSGPSPKLSDLSAEKRALLEARLLKKTSAGREAPIRRRAGAQPCPLSFAQERLWFLHQLDPKAAFYNISEVLRLRGNLDLGTLNESLSELMRRHEALRTTFAADGAEPVQIVHPAKPVRLVPVSLEDVADAGREEKARQLAQVETGKAFDLVEGPLVRFQLFRLSANDHVLALHMHHIVSDGWSMGVLIRELGRLYRAQWLKEPAGLGEAPLQYADFALWQREWSKGPAYAKQLEYWRKQLAGAPALLELPADRPRPNQQSFRGGVVSTELSGALSAELNILSRREGATPFMTLLAAFQAFLHRCSGADDLVVGTPVANRNRTELENIVGFFVNVLPMRARLEANPSFRELLRRVRETAMDAYSNQDLPFEKLVEELHPARTTTYNPIFQVLFVLQNAPGAALELPGLTLSPLSVGNDTAKFDLTLYVTEEAGCLRLALEYSSDLFERETALRMLGHLRVLIEGALRNPDAAIGELPLLSEAERRHLLVEVNNTRIEHPRDVRLHELFETQAARTPDSTAVIFENDRLTYRELDSRANRLAHALQKAGVGPDTLVGVALERSAEMVVALLGVLKAGGAYVPIDPAYPADRIAFMLKDSAAPVLLTQERLLKNFPPHPGKTLCLDRDWPTIAAESADKPPSAVAPDNIAYVIYTSGSTGEPKGALIPHSAICNHMLWMQRAFPLGPDDRVLQKTPISFDASVWEFYAPLLAGAQLVMARPGGHMEPDYLARAVEEHSITVLQVVPSLLQALLEEPAFAKCRTLRRQFCGGEALARELAERFSAILPWATLTNLYGPTEVAIDSLFHTWRGGEHGVTVPIGRPVDNTRAYVVDARLEPVPLGVPGELLLGGAQVGRGYHNRPKLTAEKFISAPFAPHQRLYRTGDLVKRLPDGNIEFLGRLDDQVKVRGFRIELGEIEAVLAAHPSVRDAVVVARDQNLVAYLTAQNGSVPDLAALRELLRARLPDYMVPSAFVTLEKLPLTPNGKVDRKALPAPERQPQSAGGFAAPRTPLEGKIAAIWAEVLHLERVGIDENFFDLGGHSLLATRVVARIRKITGLDVPLRLLFEHPTVADLAASLDSATTAEAMRPIARAARTRGMPLSFAQERLWILNQLNPNAPFYNISGGVRLRGRLDVDALRLSLTELVSRHEGFRTTFALEGSETVQRIHAQIALAMETLELSHLPPAEREDEASRLAHAEANKPFDLATGPLIRFQLIRLSADDHVLGIHMHHIISDGWSIGILVRELGELYHGLVTKTAVSLAPLPIQYADFAQWQRDWLKGELYERQLSFWKERLEGAPAVLPLPTDRPRPAAQTFRGRLLSEVLPLPLADGLRALARNEGATLFMTLLAAFKTLLHRYCGQDDLIVGTPIANRNRVEIENLIGFFVNMLVLRTDCSGNPTFRELLARVRETALGAYAHQDLPFEKLVEELHPARSASHNPIFQVAFILQNTPASELRLPELQLSSLPLETEASKFDLTLLIFEEPRGLRLTMEYSSDLFDRETVARMLGHFRTLLDGILARPDCRIGELPLLTEPERRQLLDQWNRTRTEQPPARCIHELVEEQAKLRPGAIAARDDKSILTYLELNDRAGRLAAKLRASGVNKDSLVAVCAERSPEMIVGLLAALKAGAAYVPIDPNYPADRIAFMLEDARAPVLLTQKHLAAQLPPHQAATLFLEDTFDAGVATPVEVSPDDLAYVIYTSGSTGRPKGVPIRHRNLFNLVCWHRNAYEIGPEDRGTQLASPAFDASVWEIWPYLTAGASLHIPDEATRSEPARLARWLADEKITVSFLPTPLAEAVLSEPWPGHAVLRALLTGGDKLHHHPADPLRFRLINHYGPTENTVVSTCIDVETGMGADVAPPIGRPLPNTQAYLLDRFLQPVPIGVPGELHVGGDQLADGYWNRPELTAEKFIQNPFRPHARLYKTGDLARYRPDGVIEFLGRLDDQVKLRGFRIELGEIESVLGQHPGVREAVVVARTEDSVQRLVAYVTVQPGAAFDANDLRVHLRAQLPEYMIPSAWVKLDQFPLSPNGKIDRKALPAPDSFDAAVAFVAPRTPMEQLLASVWMEVLRVGRVGIHDNFFDLGGYSLLATRVVSRVNEAARAGMTLPMIFQHPTLAGLAAVLEQAAAHSPADGNSAIKTLARENRRVRRPVRL